MSGIFGNFRELAWHFAFWPILAAVLAAAYGVTLPYHAFGDLEPLKIEAP